MNLKEKFEEIQINNKKEINLKLQPKSILEKYLFEIPNDLGGFSNNYFEHEKFVDLNVFYKTKNNEYPTLNHRSDLNGNFLNLEIPKKLTNKESANNNISNSNNMNFNTMNINMKMPMNVNNPMNNQMMYMQQMQRAYMMNMNPMNPMNMSQMNSNNIMMQQMSNYNHFMKNVNKNFEDENDKKEKSNFLNQIKFYKFFYLYFFLNFLKFNKKKKKKETGHILDLDPLLILILRVAMRKKGEIVIFSFLNFLI